MWNDYNEREECERNYSQHEYNRWEGERNLDDA